MAYINTGWNSTRYDRDAAAAKRKEAASGLTGAYATQAAANPYEGREFTPTFWQDIGERWFGDYSARDRFYAEQDQSADEYISQLLDAQRQESYNSPANAAARERAAGLNPDLTGVGTGEQPAPGAAPDDTPPGMGSTESETLDTLRGVGSIASAIVGAPLDMLSSMLDITDTIQTLGIKSDNKKWNEVHNWLAANPAISAYLADTDVPDVPDKYTQLAGGTEMYGQKFGISPVYQTAGFRGMSKGAQSLFKSLVGTAKYDRNGKETPGLTAARKNRTLTTKGIEKGLVEIMNSPGYSDDFASWVGSNYSEYAALNNKALRLEQQLRVQLAKSGLYLNADGQIQLLLGQQTAQRKANIAEGSFEQEYYDAMDGYAQGTAENKSADFTAAAAALDTWRKQMESDEETLYRSNLEKINNNKFFKYNPAAKAAALMTEHQRHSNYMSNLYQTHTSLQDKVIDLAGSTASSAIVKGVNPGK